MNNLITYNERMDENLQNFLFIFNMINMLALNDLLFLHGFNCELSIFILFEPCVLYISECAYKAKDVRQLELEKNNMQKNS